MKTLLAAGAALGLALTAAPAISQDANVVLTPTQQTMYDGWPAERQTMYDAWPANARSYYWTLNTDQQRGWWMLNDEQRVRVVAMTPEQRTAAWTSIMNQVNSSSNMATTTARTATPGTAATSPRFVSNAVVQNIAMDTAQGEVPICNKGETDNCINAWEAGKRGAGVTKPLDHWPGKPASQM